MEKRTGTKQIQKYNRLLIFILFCTLLHAQNKTEPIETIIDTQSNTCFIHEDFKVNIQIPQNSPYEVDFKIPDVPNYVRLISAKKTQKSARSTTIELVFSFEQEGIFYLPPIFITVKNNSIQTNLPQITVKSNATVLPHAFLQLQKEKQAVIAGKPIEFVLKTIGIERILQSSIELAENALFTRVTDTLFLFTPLESGLISLPVLKLTVLTAQGSQLIIKTEEKKITVSANTEQKKQTENTPALPAFDSAQNLESSIKQKNAEMNMLHVKSIPEKSATTVATIPAETPYKILKKIDNWLYIQYDKNKTGWILKE